MTDLQIREAELKQSSVEIEKSVGGPKSAHLLKERIQLVEKLEG